jgi:transcriptional regulator with XRE-family HTH domain
MIDARKFCASDSSIFPNLLTFLHLFMEGREWIVDLKEMIGSRIQEIRNKKGLTQDQLSEKVGISSKYLSSIERGKENPTLKTILKLARSLDVKPDEFFTHLEIEDPAKRKSIIIEMLDEADPDQLKLAYKVLSAMI